MTPANLFRDIPAELPGELFEAILENAHVRIERIVSRGHATPPGEWYDQQTGEWVLLLSGSAGLRIEDREEVLEMRPGDHVHLPPHLRHRVEWTDPAQDTVWLAVHYRS